MFRTPTQTDGLVAQLRDVARRCLLVLLQHNKACIAGVEVNHDARRRAGVDDLGDTPRGGDDVGAVCWPPVRSEVDLLGPVSPLSRLDVPTKPATNAVLGRS